MEQKYRCREQRRGYVTSRTWLPWLRLIMAAAILRARGLTSCLPPLAAGFKQSKFRLQRRERARETLEGFCQGLEEALMIPNKDLNRLILARDGMRR